MNKLSINITNSNIKNYELSKNYELILIKPIGNGAYGYIFYTQNNDVVKILCDNIYEEKDNISEYSEDYVIDKIINNKNNFTVNNNNYALGKIIYNENKEESCNIKAINTIELNVIPYESKEIIHSSVTTNRKKTKFVLYETNYVVIMPLYLSFYNYFECFPSRKPFRSEQLLIFLMNKLIQSIDELLMIGILNNDIKMNNIMIDKNMNIKIIDFGLTKSIEQSFVKIDTDIKYYAWSDNKDFTYNNQLCYMISIFILEIIFDKRVTDLQNNPENIKYILYDFLSQQYILNIIKKLIKESILKGIDYNEYKDIIKKQYEIYDFNDFALPNIYYLGLYNKRIVE